MLTAGGRTLPKAIWLSGAVRHAAELEPDGRLRNVGGWENS